MPSAAAHRYLALGDSYTIGEAVAARECWPAQLARALQQRADVEAMLSEIQFFSDHCRRMLHSNVGT